MMYPTFKLSVLWFIILIIYLFMLYVPVKHYKTDLPGDCKMEMTSR